MEHHGEISDVTSFCQDLGVSGIVPPGRMQSRLVQRSRRNRIDDACFGKVNRRIQILKTQLHLPPN